MLLLVVNKVLAVGTIAGQIFIVLGLIAFFLYRQDSGNRFLNFFGQHGLLLAWLMSVVATASSLFYSEFAGFEPCFLCWWQRIFMYPQVVLLGLALWRKDWRIADYGLPLAVLGAVISLYHNYLYYGGSSIVRCDAFGRGVSCLRLYIFEFSYVTLPLMALTGFILVVFLLGLQHWYNRRSIS
ncbi:disulfide bond formation protein B [Candidatus Falkowbacteria bacterium]|nr:disulfide bond formation protein B [Candidatus Falkowbacteria bacterium]